MARTCVMIHTEEGHSALIEMQRGADRREKVAKNLDQNGGSAEFSLLTFDGKCQLLQ